MQSFWQDRPTFVTGATGLVGSHLVGQLIASGADVVCLVRDEIPTSLFCRNGFERQVRMVRGDVCDQPLLERTLGEYEIDTVFHLAAQAIVGVANRNAVSTFQTNVGGTWSLLEACRRSPRVRQIVVASSDKAYGGAPELPYREETPLAATHPYDVSKACADLIAKSYACTFNLPVAITRCGNFFGPGDLQWNRIVPGTIRALVRQQRPVIRSDGQFVRDYFFVEDGAAAYLLLAEQLAARPELRGRAYNFSHEQPLTVLDLVRRICGLMNVCIEPEILNEASHEIREQFLSAEKARAELGWRPHFDLDAALLKTIAWYREFLAGVGEVHERQVSTPWVARSA
jgi:CDP-glucose 4,6-dehydratase